MTRVKLGGRELYVEDADVDMYVSRGYSIIDSRGNVLQKGTTTNYDQLLMENSELREAVKRLTGSCNALQEELTECRGRLNDALDRIKQFEDSSTGGDLEPPPDSAGEPEGTQVKSTSRTRRKD